MLLLLATPAAAQAADKTEVFNANFDVWNCFHAGLRKVDDGKTQPEMLAKILAAKCDPQIQRYEFATQGNPQQVNQDWYDRQLEQWKLLFMGTILEKRNEK